MKNEIVCNVCGLLFKTNIDYKNHLFGECIVRIKKKKKLVEKKVFIPDYDLKQEKLPL